MSPSEHDPDEAAHYAEAIGQLMAAAQRTRDPEAWLTLTALAEMFVKLDQQHRVAKAAHPTARLAIDSPHPSPGRDKPS